MLEPARHLADVARTRLSGARPAIRLLVASDDTVYTSEQQLAPLRAYRRALRDELGVVSSHVLIGDALALPTQLIRGYDAIFWKLGFRTPESAAIAVAKRLRDRAGERVKLVYLDGDDDLCVLWPSLLAHVDLYVKKHVFADREQYRRAWIGKTNLTDHVARTHAVSFERDPFPSTRPVPERELGKIVLGWNIALDDRIRALHARTGGSLDDRPRDIDVICRASFVADSWIHPLRAPVATTLRRLDGEHRVVTPEQPVSPEVYAREMSRSRICVSPFGYGELCWRDFEAILAGCLLVKPDVAHLATEPDVFVPRETYVPVRWDLSDLESTLRHHLARPDEIDRIRRNAFERLASYYAQGGFVRAFARVLDAAGVVATGGPAPRERRRGVVALRSS